MTARLEQLEQRTRGSDRKVVVHLDASALREQLQGFQRQLERAIETASRAGCC